MSNTEEKVKEARERLCLVCKDGIHDHDVIRLSGYYCHRGLNALTSDGKDCPYYRLHDWNEGKHLNENR